MTWIFVSPVGCQAAGRLRTSVACDENQTQGDSSNQVDEGLRRVDNEMKWSLRGEIFLNQGPHDSVSNLRKERNHESERRRRQRPQQDSDRGSDGDQSIFPACENV